MNELVYRQESTFHQFLLPVGKKREYTINVFKGTYLQIKISNLKILAGLQEVINSIGIKL